MPLPTFRVQIPSLTTQQTLTRSSSVAQLSWFFYEQKSIAPAFLDVFRKFPYPSAMLRRGRPPGTRLSRPPNLHILPVYRDSFSHA